MPLIKTTSVPPWLTLGMGSVMVAALAFTLTKWVIYAHPATAVKAEVKTTTDRTVHRNVVTVERVRSPDGVVRETTTTDLSTEEARTLASSLSSSLSTPVFAPRPWFGVSVGRDLVTQDWMGGIVVAPLEVLHLGLDTTLRFDRFFVRGTLWLR